MKITENREWSFTIDNETIRAIRHITGFNTNLRVKIHACKDDPRREKVWYFLKENAEYLFPYGYGRKIKNMHSNDPEWDKMERALEDLVSQIFKM